MNTRPSNVPVSFAAEDEFEPPSLATQMHARGRIALRVLFLALLPIVVFGSAVRGGFILSDHDEILANPAMRSFRHGLRKIWLSPNTLPHPSPLAYTVLLVEARVFEHRPAAFHAVSLLLHAANGCLLWWLLTRLKIPGALAAAALFAVHPAHAETIAWVSQQRVLLCSMFYLCALLCWSRARPRLIPAIVLMTASALCHPLGLTFPLAAAGLRWWRPPEGVGRSELAVMLLVGGVMAACVVLVYGVGAADAGSSSSVRPGTPALHPALYLAWAAVIAAVVATVATVARRGSTRAVLVAPIAACVAVVVLGTFAAVRVQTYRTDRSIWTRALEADPHSPVALTQLARIESREHRSPQPAIDLLERALRADPSNRAALLHLADARARLGEWDRAVTNYQQVLSRDPNDADAHFGLAVAYAHQDRSSDAVREMNQVLRLRPNDARAHRELGALHRERGELKESLDHHRRAIELDPHDADAYIELAALLYNHFDDAARAQDLLVRARRLDPSKLETILLAGGIQFELAKRQDDPARRADALAVAVTFYREAVRLAPDSALAHKNLGIALAAAARHAREPRHALDALDEAIFCFERSIALDPDQPDAIAMRDAAIANREALSRQAR